ncbi:MAG: hypothetical protein AB8B72_03870 [Crocinitomicaceae bacterium]
MKLIKVLENGLSSSTTKERQIWAISIVENNHSVMFITKHFLKSEDKILSRYLWLLSDIGKIAPIRLNKVLSLLMSFKDSIKIKNIESTYANYWLIAGIPEQDEAEVIDLLLKWINSSTMNVTTKSRAILILDRMITKYPDLKNEFKLSLQLQLNKYSSNFSDKVSKRLEALKE